MSVLYQIHVSGERIIKAVCIVMFIDKVISV